MTLFILPKSYRNIKQKKKKYKIFVSPNPLNPPLQHSHDIHTHHQINQPLPLKKPRKPCSEYNCQTYWNRWKKTFLRITDRDSNRCIVDQLTVAQPYSNNRLTSESAFLVNFTMFLHMQCFLYFRGRTLLSHPSLCKGSQWAQCPKKPGSGMQLPTVLTPIWETSSTLIVSIQ